MNSSDYRNSYSDMNSSDCKNSQKDTNSSEYMNSHNDNVAAGNGSQNANTF